MTKEMSLLDHLQELKDRVLRIFASIAIIAVFTFAFSFQPIILEGQPVKIAEYTLIIPWPDPFNNIASQLIRTVGNYQLPTYVEFIITGPAQAIVAQLYVSIFLGFVVSMPVIIYEIAAFVNPALYPNEKKTILKLLLPATLLFLGGCLFSYFLITPWTIDFLYRYGLILNAATYITIDAFITFVLLFVIAFGISFELPVIMWLVSKAGIVQPSFWLKNFRYAIVVMAIYGALITPDGSGITMWFVTVPMILLYLGGYLVIRRSKKE